MARVANRPVRVPSGVEINFEGVTVSVKGPKGTLSLDIHEEVRVDQRDGALAFAPKRETRAANALAGTMRALVSNMIDGVTRGFERKLEMMGVGYRAQMQGKMLNVNAGYSHPVNFSIPDGVTVETPSQTEIVVKGIDKQQVGQVAAKIRAIRPPEPYKGKGIRYSNERVILKEGKKK